MRGNELALLVSASLDRAWGQKWGCQERQGP